PRQGCTPLPKAYVASLRYCALSTAHCSLDFSIRRQRYRLRVVVLQIGHLHIAAQNRGHLVAMIDNVARLRHEDVVAMDEKCLQRFVLLFLVAEIFEVDRRWLRRFRRSHDWRLNTRTL